MTWHLTYGCPRQTLCNLSRLVQQIRKIGSKLFHNLVSGTDLVSQLNELGDYISSETLDNGDIMIEIWI